MTCSRSARRQKRLRIMTRLQWHGPVGRRTLLCCGVPIFKVMIQCRVSGSLRVSGSSGSQSLRVLKCFSVDGLIQAI